MKAIILYYSRSGNTEKLAKQIQADLNCEMIKIEPEVAYGNYVASCVRATKEKMSTVKPKFVTPIPDLQGYDTVLLGFPIWAQDLPAFVSEFVNQCDLNGKTVIPFATFGMTGLNWTKKTLERVCKGAKIEHPFNYGVFKKDNYRKWLESVKI